MFYSPSTTSVLKFMFSLLLLKILNRARVICITSQRDNQSIKHLQDLFLKFVNQANKKAASSDT